MNIKRGQEGTEKKSLKKIRRGKGREGFNEEKSIW